MDKTVDLAIGCFCTFVAVYVLNELTSICAGAVVVDLTLTVPIRQERSDASSSAAFLLPRSMFSAKLVRS